MLTQLLSERYSNDPDVGQWIAKYSGIYYRRIQQYLWNPSDLHREFSTLKEQYEKLKTENDDLRKQLRRQQNPMPKKQRSSTSKTQKAASSKKVQYIKIKKTIEDSFSEDRLITGEFIYIPSTMNDCFDALKKLDNLRMYTGLVFLDLRTFRAGQRLLPRDLTGNRIPAIILSLSRKPGPGFSKIRHLLFLTADSRVADERNMDCFLLFRDRHNFYWHELGDQLVN